MKLWQLNAKLRRFLDRISWPLVTRKRFVLMIENFEAELEHAESANEMLRARCKRLGADVAVANSIIEKRDLIPDE